MSRFEQLPEFQKELKRLGKKYPSLFDDLKRFEVLICECPTGIGKNFSIIHFENKCHIVKARLACKSLKDRSIRVIYAYHEQVITFVYIEMYAKSEKQNEDRDRIEYYLKNIKS
jgi:mRNA-degrading endonuclease RelE of RelBE toxin-antitoxin system